MSQPWESTLPEQNTREQEQPSAEQLSDAERRAQEQAQRKAERKEREELLGRAKDDQAAFEQEATRQELDVVELLKHREIEEIKQLKGSANGVEAVKFKDDGWAIFKSSSAEVESRGRPTIEVGSYYKREAAAFVVDDQLLHFEMVPPTVTRTITRPDGQPDIGSVQQFVTGKLLLEHSEAEYKEFHQSQIFKLWILDYVLWSSDRHRENFLFSDKKLRAIDNGFAFSDEAPAIIHKDYFDQEVPPEIKEQLAAAEAGLDVVNDQGVTHAKVIEQQLAELVGAEQARACLERLRLIARVVREEGVVKPDFDKGAWLAKRPQLALRGGKGPKQRQPTKPV